MVKGLNEPLAPLPPQEYFQSSRSGDWRLFGVSLYVSLMNIYP